jgi:hypothetical protein
MNDFEKLDKIWDLLNEVNTLNNEELEAKKDELFEKLCKFESAYKQIENILEKRKLQKWLAMC